MSCENKVIMEKARNFIGTGKLRQALINAQCEERVIQKIVDWATSAGRV